MTDTLALWILFGLLSVGFVAMQFAFRPKPSTTPGIMLIPVDFIGDIKIVPWGTGTADITRWPVPRP